jgi:Trk K+ transport system NAD-binding subunit
VSDDSWIPRRSRSGERRRDAARVREEFQPRRVRRPIAEGPRGHLIVCGDDPLAHRLVDELVQRHRRKVTVILSSKRRGHGPQIAGMAAVKVVEADRLDDDAFRAAGIATADAVALVHQDDVGNIHAALRVQELNPRLRLVIRMYNMGLGDGVRRLIPECRVLSDAAMAAPEFVSAALGEVAPVHVRLAGRTLFVARRPEVAANTVMCGLAVTADRDQPELLPPQQDHADLVLAVADGHAVLDPAVGGNRRRGRRAGRPWGRVPMLFSRRLRIAALVLVALLIVGTVILKLARGGDTTWLNAAYLTVLDTLAGANPDPTAKPLVKVIETALTIVSIALIPLVTAAVVDAAVNARLALALGRLKQPISDHIVVVGLGNVGTRVIRRLHDLGVPVVAIDKDDNARGIPVARKLGIPYIIGEASSEETLRAASVQTSRALVVLSTDDVTNLEAALHGRGIQEDLRVVLRLFDGDFADRVQRAFRITISRSVSYLAAPAFAAAMVNREVVGTIPVGRRALLVAEVPVCAGSELAGAPLAAANASGATHVIAVTVQRQRTTLWTPDPRRSLESDDVLLVVATKDGLGRLSARTAAPN